MRAEILRSYGAKIDALRRSLPGRDITAAVRTLIDERTGTLKALALRKQVMLRAGREQRAAERFSERLAQHTAARKNSEARVIPTATMDAPSSR